jgi:hypothetical protein
MGCRHTRATMMCFAARVSRVGPIPTRRCVAQPAARRSASWSYESTAIRNRACDAHRAENDARSRSAKLRRKLIGRASRIWAARRSSPSARNGNTPPKRTTAKSMRSSLAADPPAANRALAVVGHPTSFGSIPRILIGLNRCSQANVTCSQSSLAPVRSQVLYSGQDATYLD